MSIHRATTVGPKSPLCQVILKNTTNLKDTSTSTSRRPINRSQSLLTTNSRTPVLAPSRGERARLEALLADVWSRNVLPFPGMTARSRSEHLVRSSATTMMRKLSVANITSSLGKRSTSVPSMPKANDDALSHIDLDALDFRHNDEPGWISTLDINAESSKKPEHSSIRDGSERSSKNISSSSIESAGAAMSGTVRKVDLSQLDTVWSAEDEETGAPTLRTSSANSSPPHRRQCQSEKSETSTSSRPPGKENAYQKSRRQDWFIRSPLSSMKSSSKWSRVSTINRGMMSSSLRSFFR